MMLVNAKERPVVVVEDMMGSNTLKQALAKALFLHFDVPCVAAVPGHIVSLFALGSQTAFVIDVGHLETTVLPVCQGLGLVKCWSTCQLGSSSVNRQVDHSF